MTRRGRCNPGRPARRTSRRAAQRLVGHGAPDRNRGDAVRVARRDVLLPAVPEPTAAGRRTASPTRKILKPLLATVLLVVSSVPLALAAPCCSSASGRSSALARARDSCSASRSSSSSGCSSTSSLRHFRPHGERLRVDLLHADRRSTARTSSVGVLACVWALAPDAALRPPERAPDAARDGALLAFRQRRRRRRLPDPLPRAARMTSTRRPTASHASALAWFGVLAPPLAWAAQLVIGLLVRRGWLRPTRRRPLGRGARAV